MDEARKVFIDYLHRQRMKVTEPRLAIVNAIFSRQKFHFLADDLLRIVNARRREKISRATVYRTLALLEESGLLRRERYGGEVSSYEKALHEGHHDHLICTECGSVTEFYSDELEKTQRRIARRHRFKSTDHVLQIFGVCEKCAK